MPTQPDQTERRDGSVHGAPVMEAPERDWRSLEKSAYTLEKILALVILAFIATSIVVMTMPPLFSDDIEIIYFRVGKATSADNPAYIMPKDIRSSGDLSPAHGNRVDRPLFVPPGGAGQYVNTDVPFTDDKSHAGFTGTYAPLNETIACPVQVARKEIPHEI